MTFSETGIDVRTEGSEGHVKWSTIIKVEENPDYIFLFLGTFSGYILPKQKIGNWQAVNAYILEQLNKRG